MPKLPELTLSQMRVLAATAMSAVLIVFIWRWWSAPVAEPLQPVRIRPATHTSGITLLVDVVGKVRHPGVVRLQQGARVYEAVAAAGGVVGGRAPGVNMARPVVDGEQIVIGQSASTGAAARIDLNSADAAALDALPGVGPVLAARIIAHRQTHGRFTRVRDLLDVSGIGESTLADLETAGVTV